MRVVGKGKISIAKIKCHKRLVYTIHVVCLAKAEISLSLNYPVPKSRKKTKKNCYTFLRKGLRVGWKKKSACLFRNNPT